MSAIEELAAGADDIKELVNMVTLMDMRDKAFDRMLFERHCWVLGQLQRLDAAHPKLYNEAERLYLDSVQGAASEYVKGSLLDLLITAVRQAGS